MSEHPLDPTTHTVEMTQIAELNEHLKLPQSAPVTAADLGLQGARMRGGRGAGGSLAGPEVVVSVSWTGSPAFPDIFANFGVKGTGQVSGRVQLHTAQLKELSHRLGLRHGWGL